MVLKAHMALPGKDLRLRVGCPLCLEVGRLTLETHVPVMPQPELQLLCQLPPHNPSLGNVQLFKKLKTPEITLTHHSGKF